MAVNLDVHSTVNTMKKLEYQNTFCERSHLTKNPILLKNQQNYIIANIVTCKINLDNVVLKYNRIPVPGP